MSKFKVSLSVNLPDFKLPVDFMLPNGVEANIVFTVKHIGTDEVQKMYLDKDMTDEKFITNLAVGWDLEDEFNVDNVRKAAHLYPSVAIALPQAYLSALAGYRVKN